MQNHKKVITFPNVEPHDLEKLNIKITAIYSFARNNVDRDESVRLIKHPVYDTRAVFRQYSEVGEVGCNIEEKIVKNLMVFGFGLKYGT